MIKTTFFSITAALALTTAASASIVSLSGNTITPTFGGNPVPGALINVGLLSGVPAGGSIADVGAVFTEFGSTNIPTGGFFPNTLAGSVTNNGATAPDFNMQQVYVWVLNTDDVGTATGHVLLTRDDWAFPEHVGNGTDSVTLSITEATLADATLAPVGAGVDGRNLVLVPEPSGTLLAGLAGLLLVFRRRR